MRDTQSLAENKLTRRCFNGALAAAGAALPQSDEAARRPNILFICSDQHIGTYMGCQKHPIVRTPNMDRLASRGTLFRTAYSNAPVCVPARASLMTGMFASDVNSFSNSTCFTGGFPTWGNRLRDAGYHCWATGKLDLTEGVDFGFQEFQTEHGHSSRPDITSLFRAPVGYRVDTRRTIDGEFRDHVPGDDGRIKATLDFLRLQAPRLGKPWAAYVGLLLPHPPFVGNRKFENLYPPQDMPLPELPRGHLDQLHIPFQVLRDFNRVNFPIPEQRLRRARAAYLAMITELDAYLGQLLNELENSGQIDNTVVVYTSDHGEMLGEHGMWSKCNLLENAARVPMIIAGGGFPKGRIVETPVSLADLAPTLMELAGAPSDHRLRGRGLLSATGRQKQEHPGIAFAESHSEGNCTGSFMIRKGDWKYIHFTWYGDLLFNLRSDPGEFTNLVDDPACSAIKGEMHSILRELVDPEAVTRRAFDEHEKRLTAIVRQNTAEQFYKLLVSRLGPGQARALTYRHYKG